MNKTSAGDVTLSSLKPRTRRLMKKLPIVVFERSQYVGPAGGMLVGTLLGTVGSSELSWLGVLILCVMVWVAMAVIIGVQTYFAMLYAKIDWWRGWLAFTEGKYFYDNPNDWVTKEEYAAELEQESEW